MRIQSISDIEETANSLRKKYCFDNFPIQASDIAKQLGIKIVYFPFKGRISGALIRKDDTWYMGVNSLHHFHRQNFTCAHEIGHVILHDSDKVLCLDGDGSKLEMESNTFAAELLMPKEIILSHTNRCREDLLDSIIPTFTNVSREALQWRLYNLGLVKASDMMKDYVVKELPDKIILTSEEISSFNTWCNQ